MPDSPGFFQYVCRRLPGPAGADAESLYAPGRADDRVELPQQVAVGSVKGHQHPATGA